MTCLFASALSTLRVTKVDACGKPIAGMNAFANSCITTLSMTAVTDDQDDRIWRAANGNLCAVRRGCKALLGYDVELSVLFSSPELTSIITGNPVYLDSGGATVGNDFCQAIPCREGFALEAWIEVEDPTGVCDVTGAQKYLYVLIPWLTNGTLGDLEFGTDVVNFTYTGSSRAGGQWGTGPFNVVLGVGDAPSPMTTALGSTCHRRILTTELAPPTSSCDFVTVPSVP